MSIKEDIEKVQKKVNVIEEQSFAMELLQDAKITNKRLFIVWLITFVAFVGLLGYTIYLLNDISSVETTTTQEVNDINTVGGNITNGGE
jgi:hypothetical protein